MLTRTTSSSSPLSWAGNLAGRRAVSSAQKITNKCHLLRHLKARLRVTGFDLDFGAGRSMQPFGLNKEAAEQQDAQNQYYCDDDDLDEAHNKLLKVEPGAG